MVKIPLDTIKLLAISVERFYTSLSKRLKFQHSPLYIVAEQGNLSLFEFVNERVGFKNPNPTRNDGSTPFYFAAQNGHLEICKFIIEKVENENPPLHDGFTPLHLVASRSEAHDGSNGPLIRLDEDTQVRFFKVVHMYYNFHYRKLFFF